MRPRCGWRKLWSDFAADMLVVSPLTHDVPPRRRAGSRRTDSAGKEVLRLLRILWVGTRIETVSPANTFQTQGEPHGRVTVWTCPTRRSRDAAARSLLLKIVREGEGVEVKGGAMVREGHEFEVEAALLYWPISLDYGHWTARLEEEGAKGIAGEGRVGGCINTR